MSFLREGEVYEAKHSFLKLPVSTRNQATFFEFKKLNALFHQYLGFGKISDEPLRRSYRACQTSLRAAPRGKADFVLANPQITIPKLCAFSLLGVGKRELLSTSAFRTRRYCEER